jgi:hypothetical protein
MESGWLRWLLESFEFPFEVVHPRTLDAGGLRERFDVLLLPGGSVPTAPPRGGGAPDTTTLEPGLRAMLGTVTAEHTVPQLRAFLEQGGTIVTIGSGANLVRLLELPLADALVEEHEGRPRPLPRAKYYVPGSILAARVDSTHPAAHGLPGQVDFLFDNSPVFRLADGADTLGVRTIAWFDSAAPLRSGWAWGQHHLAGGLAAASVPLGAGQLLVFGPEITFRAQPHGTFKLLFNGILLGAAEMERIR